MIGIPSGLWSFCLGLSILSLSLAIGPEIVERRKYPYFLRMIRRFGLNALSVIEAAIEY